MKIKDIRKETQLSQSKFALEYGIPVRTLQQWEQDVSRPPEYVPELIRRVISLESNMNKTSYISSLKLPPRNSWNICIDNPFKNCDKIYPIQQRKVKELISDMSQNNNVKRIIVFGSSVSDRCHIGSDIDVYAEMLCDENPISQSHEFEYDFWNNFRVDERLKAEILKKGIVVYG